VALGKAAELASEWLNESAGADELAGLRDRLEHALLAAIPSCGVNGAGVPRTANTTNLYFDHIEAESLVITLDLNGVSVSGGSACQSGASEPSHVLTAMGLAPARARASIRISLSRMTSAGEIEEAIRLIPAAVAQLRSISRSWKAATAPEMATA
jgi:cysteine desulfurase